MAAIRGNVPRSNAGMMARTTEPRPGAPGATSAISPERDSKITVAPFPTVDRYPIIIGQNLNFTYIASCMRLAQLGYRMQYVDLLSEFIDHEPHGFSEISKRCIAVAGARFEIVSCDAGNAQADEIATHVDAQLKQIPFLKAALFRLIFWGEYGGVGAEEILWRLEPDGTRWVDKLQMIHSRRLTYPDWMLWDLHIWDQGYGGGAGSDTKDFGLRVADYPDKFIVHSPSLRAEYPVREGYGRVLMIYMALKRLVVRNTGQDFERFIKPWVIAYFSTASIATGKPRVANDADIAAANAAMRGVGVGSLAGVTLPDSIRIELLRAVTAMTPVEFLSYLDRSITMVCAGQTYTSSPGASGARAASEVSQKDTDAIQRFSAEQLAESLRATIVRIIVALNFPGQEKLIPHVVAHVEEKLSSNMMLDNATKAALLGGKVDGGAVMKQAGVPVIDPDDKDAVRMLPITPVAVTSIKPGGEVEAPPEPPKPGPPVSFKPKLEP